MNMMTGVSLPIIEQQVARFCRFGPGKKRTTFPSFAQNVEGSRAEHIRRIWCRRYVRNLDVVAADSVCLRTIVLCFSQSITPRASHAAAK
jgi:hypothetical protein